MTSLRVSTRLSPRARWKPVASSCSGSARCVPLEPLRLSIELVRFYVLWSSRAQVRAGRHSRSGEACFRDGSSMRADTRGRRTRRCAGSSVGGQPPQRRRLTWSGSSPGRWPTGSTGFVRVSANGGGGPGGWPATSRLSRLPLTRIPARWRHWSGCFEQPERQRSTRSRGRDRGVHAELLCDIRGHRVRSLCGQ